MQHRPRRALYSILVGDYERLNEQETMPETDVDRILLTDDPELTSDAWRVVVVERTFAADPVRSQRLLKIVGHPVLDEYDETLYVDNSVELRVDPNVVLDAWLAEHDMGLPLHSYRERTIDEFDVVLSLAYDEPARLYEQLLHYGHEEQQALEAQPFWTAILARRRTPQVAAAMRLWADHVLRYSRRDQLSATVALAGLDLEAVPLDNWSSDWHRWPRDLDRRTQQGKVLRPPSGPLIAEIVRLERQVADLERREWEAISTRDAAETRADAAEGRVDALEAEAQEARTTADERMQVLDATHASPSWRITAPLRRASAAARRLRG